MISGYLQNPTSQEEHHSTLQILTNPTNPDMCLKKKQQVHHMSNIFQNIRDVLELGDMNMLLKSLSPSFGTSCRISQLWHISWVVQVTSSKYLKQNNVYHIALY